MPNLSQTRHPTLLRLLRRHVRPRRRLQLVLLMLLSGFAELLTVASLVPFLAALSDPASLWRKPWVRAVAATLGFAAPQQRIPPITLLVMAAGLISAANLSLNSRLSALIGMDWAVEGYSRSLEQSDVMHLERNSSEVITANNTDGLPPKRIVRERLVWAAASAQAGDLIPEQPKGFDTPAGKRCVRLSGGQRQPLGFDRALNQQADMQILDEAISARGNLTKQAVIDLLGPLGHGDTIMMSVHRLSFPERCHRIIQLRGCQIHGLGTDAKLQVKGLGFRRRARASLAEVSMLVEG